MRQIGAFGSSRPERFEEIERISAEEQRIARFCELGGIGVMLLVGDDLLGVAAAVDGRIYRVDDVGYDGSPFALRASPPGEHGADGESPSKMIGELGPEG